jgi:hypothetical protein
MAVETHEYKSMDMRMKSRGFPESVYDGDEGGGVHELTIVS